MAMFNGRVLLSIIETIIEDTIILYRDDPNLQLFVNWIQINVKCCGDFSPHDWNNNIYFRCGTLCMIRCEHATGI
ncbi:Tetraspanin-10 [Dirofilaria immitis]